MAFLKSKLGRFFLIIVAILIVTNIMIVLSGRTYLYKGIQETYLKGKTGPGIYDSLVFPTKIAAHSLHPEEWMRNNEEIELSQQSIDLLESLNTTSLLIVKDQKIVHESYFGDHNKDRRSNTFSMAKSFIGLLIGIAIDEGKIASFNAPISEYLPFRLANDEGVTIRDLLGMSSGLDWSESGSNPFSHNAEAYYTSDLFSMMKKMKFDWEPGTKFEYASGNSQLLGIIIENAVGLSPTEYFEQKIWKKIGTEHDLLWSLDHKDGIEKTFCCGYATTRDYAKMGQLILNKGEWNQQQIISQATLEEIISPYNETETHYGLHFWIYNHPKHPSVYFRGILGQYIIVIPSLDILIVRTGHSREESYFIPEKNKSDIAFVKENSYKEYHPLDMADYYTILEEVLAKLNSESTEF